ncbi:MAG: hypothetical protein JNK56_29780, partial [Myxococcales bacterium]|nr:hypothetical protein [Myxococcales bacterium]
MSASATPRDPQATPRRLALADQALGATLADDRTPRADDRTTAQDPDITPRAEPDPE